jgi:hypothetical protein
MKNRPLLCLTLSLCFGLAAAQNDVEALYTVKRTNLEIDVFGNDLKIRENYFSEKKFFKNFEKHARESVYYSDFDPVLSLDAVTMIPVKSGFKKANTAIVETEDIFQSGIFYGGYKRKNFAYPSIVAGSVGRLEYVKDIKEVHLLTPFYFDDDVPTTSAEFSVSFPATVTLRYKLFGSDSDKIVMTEKRSGGKIIYTWEFKDVPAFKEEIGAPSRPYAAPHLIVYVESYETKAGKKKILSDVSDLYHWYDGLIRQIPNDNKESLQALVKELTTNLSTPSAKTKAIFQWVQRNIKYIAFEDGMAGFVPRSSTDVYTKRYGDCKDMANLLKDMLALAGIEAHHTWIGTRSKPYTYQDVPTAIADNHMICSVKTPEGYIFLDATNPFLSFGTPSSMIQNKEALIGLSSGRYEVVKVPVVNKSENKRIDSLLVQVEKDGIKGKFKSELTGFRKDDMEVANLRAQIRNDREYIRDFFTIGGNNIAIDQLEVKGLGDQNLSASVTFNFSQPGYIKNVADKLYINLHLNKSVPGEKLDVNTRQQLLEQDYHYEDHSYTFFSIPEGYDVTFTPASVNKSWSAFGIEVSYKTEKNQVIMEKTIYSNYLYLDKNGFSEWNEFLDALNTIQQQSFTLTKKK